MVHSFFSHFFGKLEEYIGTPLQKIQIVQPREGKYLRSYAITPENILARLDFSIARGVLISLTVRDFSLLCPIVFLLLTDL